MILRFSIFGKAFTFTFKFAFLTVLLVLLFVKLGLWQVHRASEKKLLIQSYQDRAHQPPLTFTSLFQTEKDPRFYSLHLKGHFDNAHTVLLDNKTVQSRLGYEVYTPFLVEGSSKALLVDRGFIPADQDRSRLPSLKPVVGTISIQGVVNLPPAYFSLGTMTEAKNTFPLRIQYVDPKALSTVLGLSLAPYILWLDPMNPHGFQREWKITPMSPEKHWMYAVQWFAFALSLLVLFVVLNIHRDEEP